MGEGGRGRREGGGRRGREGGSGRGKEGGRQEVSVDRGRKI